MLARFTRVGTPGSNDQAYLYCSRQTGTDGRFGEVETLSDCGLRGDRYADPVNRKTPDYQLTLIELEKIEAFVRESGLPLAPHEPRRNLVTVGTDLNELCGKRFLVGQVELEGLVFCEPCSAFANNTHGSSAALLRAQGRIKGQNRQRWLHSSR